MTKTPMEVVNLPVKDVKPAAYNPRTWNEDQITALEESITRFGLVDPLICNAARSTREF